MTRAKVISIIVVVLSGLLAIGGSAGFFSRSLAQMPVIGAVTASALIVFLVSGMVWTLIEIAQSLVEFSMLSRTIPPFTDSKLGIESVNSVPGPPTDRISARHERVSLLAPFVELLRARTRRSCPQVRTKLACPQIRCFPRPYFLSRRIEEPFIVSATNVLTRLLVQQRP